MQADLPKTINEALKILAYNDYFWHGGPKTPNQAISPHPKDRTTVESLAEAQYAWTEKQGKLAVVLLKRYLTKFQAHGMDISALLQNPQYEAPFRVITLEKFIDKFIDEDEVPKIELRFPYHKKLITLVRALKDSKGLPGMYAQYDGESKKWTFRQTDVTTYYLTLIAIRYDFNFMDTTLLDEYYTVKKEIRNFKKPSAELIGKEIVLKNVNDTLQDYWNEKIKNKKLLEQVDSLKDFAIDTKNIEVDASTTIAKKIAHSGSDKLWIDSTQYSKNEVIAGLKELNCFPIIMPIAGDIQTREDVLEWQDWLKTFEQHGISSTKNLSFGFDLLEPVRSVDDYTEHKRQTYQKNLGEPEFQFWYDLYQISKQFKYIDVDTKIIFVRNRIPRTLIKSKIKPKASLVAIGGGYYAAGTENLKRFLDNMSKKLYYNDHRPSSWDWHDRIIIKL